ncbi:hypothetical protein B857_00807 [Solibacillus isronensis B3W22]|uniref:Uncharacterized protein n=1 Tax=Solibacillus isronensis B3W22 TaxID=1224748 RepID=K1L3C0_9BACL|nr:hypothetical protein B857_00807 [Solibacillus isronensis B3W22]
MKVELTATNGELNSKKVEQSDRKVESLSNN